MVAANEAPQSASHRVKAVPLQAVDVLLEGRRVTSATTRYSPRAEAISPPRSRTGRGAAHQTQAPALKGVPPRARSGQAAGHRRRGLVQGNRGCFYIQKPTSSPHPSPLTVDVRLIPRADVASSGSYDGKATLTNDDRTLARMTVATALSKRFPFASTGRVCQHHPTRDTRGEV